jgi:hypothetical protein
VRKAFLLLLFPLLACGGSLTAPRPEPVAFAFHFATAKEQAQVCQTWDEVRACVGEPVRGELIRVTVDNSIIDCSDERAPALPSWGCTFFQPTLSVFVIREGLGPPYHVERHELIHALLYLRGEDVGHSNPAFGRCDK